MSKLLKCDPRWTGAACHTPTINLIVLVLTITTFLLSIIYGRKLDVAQEQSQNISSDTKHLSTSAIFFYSGFAPLVSILYLIIVDILHTISRAPPVTSLCVSVLFLLVWIIQYVFWTTCDLPGFGDSSGFCSHWPDIDSHGTPVLVWVRFAFGLFCLIGFLVLMIFTAMAVHFERRSGRGLNSGSGDAGNKQNNENYEL